MLATPELIQEAAQRHRLAELLPGWVSRIPLYHRCKPASTADAPGLATVLLATLPLITKRDIRASFPFNFLGPDADLEHLVESQVLELEHTAGTSEARTPLLLPRGWWAEQELRALRLNPLVVRLFEENPGARRVTISSPVCSGDISYTGTPSRQERILGNTLFINLSRYPFLWSEADLERMVSETLDWQPRFLDVDPVYGAIFALYCERRHLRFPSLRLIISSYEFLSVTHRRILQRVFGVPVFNLYGSTETGHLLMENTQGEMQPVYETAFLETVDADEQGIGELVVTTLTNDLMPLLHYRIGDLAERREQPFGTRYVIHGRAADAFLTCTGRRITTRQIDRCFAGVGGILHYQLLENGPADWCLKFVPEGSGPEEQALSELGERLCGLLALNTPPHLEVADMFVPEGSGKFRLGYPRLSAGPLHTPSRETAAACK